MTVVAVSASSVRSCAFRPKTLTGSDREEPHLLAESLGPALRQRAQTCSIVTSHSTAYWAESYCCAFRLEPYWTFCCNSVESIALNKHCIFKILTLKHGQLLHQTQTAKEAQEALTSQAAVLEL